MLHKTRKVSIIKSLTITILILLLSMSILYGQVDELQNIIAKKFIEVWSNDGKAAVRMTVSEENNGHDAHIANKVNFVDNGSESGGRLILTGSSGINLRYGDEGSSGKDGLTLEPNGNTNITGKLNVNRLVVDKFLSVSMGNKLLTLRNDGKDCFLSNKADFVGNKAESGGWLNINGSQGVHLLYGDEKSAGTSGLILQGNGNIGIGTIQPSAKLDVNGTIRTKLLTIVGGADIVESFESVDNICEPGDIVVIDELNPGHVRLSSDQYDNKVAGVVSGANGLEPGLELGNEVLSGSVKIAMTGRVWMKCTDENGSIRPGDRLTTSTIPGFAMKSTDRELSDGAVIGKAMTGLEEGQSLVLVLVNLQ